MAILQKKMVLGCMLALSVTLSAGQALAGLCCSVEDVTEPLGPNASAAMLRAESSGSEQEMARVSKIAHNNRLLQKWKLRGTAFRDIAALREHQGESERRTSCIESAKEPSLPMFGKWSQQEIVTYQEWLFAQLVAMAKTLKNKDEIKDAKHDALFGKVQNFLGSVQRRRARA